MCHLHHKHLTPMAGIMQEAHRCPSWRARSLGVRPVSDKTPMWLTVPLCTWPWHLLSNVISSLSPHVNLGSRSGNKRGLYSTSALHGRGERWRWSLQQQQLLRIPLLRQVAFLNECMHWVISGFPAQILMYVNPAVRWYRDCGNWECILLMKSEHWQGEVTLLFWTDTLLFLDGVSTNIKCLPSLMQFQCNTYGSRGLRCAFTRSDRSLIHDSLQAWPGYGSVDSYFLGRLVPRLLTPNKLHGNKPPGPALARNRIYDQL